MEALLQAADWIGSAPSASHLPWTSRLPGVYSPALTSKSTRGHAQSCTHISSFYNILTVNGQARVQGGGSLLCKEMHDHVTRGCGSREWWKWGPLTLSTQFPTWLPHFSHCSRWYERAFLALGGSLVLGPALEMKRYIFSLSLQIHPRNLQ